MIGHLLLLSSALEECTAWTRWALADFMGVRMGRAVPGSGAADTVWGEGHRENPGSDEEILVVAEALFRAEKVSKLFELFPEGG
jgi:hypothetical protein